eukprot:7693-Eustigmatos_ZCMA.PRE.1
MAAQIHDDHIRVQSQRGACGLFTTSVLTPLELGPTRPWAHWKGKAVSESLDRRPLMVVLESG